MDENNNVPYNATGTGTPEVRDDGNYSYSYRNTDHVTGVTGPGGTAAPYGTVPPEAGPSGYGGTPPKEKKPRKFVKWSSRVLAVILVAALAFGSGYAGALLANENQNKVIIQQAGNDENTTSDATGDDGSTSSSNTIALSSEDIASKVVPSVVAITTEQMSTNNYWFGSQVTGGAGSGVIISKDGYILTNYHVVSGADTITVELYDGTSYEGTVVGTYPKGDIAVVKIEATDLAPVTFADSDSVVQGETVYAVGNPEGTFSGSITSGIISAVDRQISVSLDDSSSYSNPFASGGITANLTVFQFDAAVSPGNSGGGLFNDNGELIGIVCAKSSDTDSEGLGFAIIGNKAQEIASSIISTGSYSSGEDDSSTSDNGATTNTNKAILGVTVAYLDASTAQSYGLSSEGLYIVSVTEDSTAQAGLEVGDRIISVDDVVVNETTDVTGYLADKNPGDTVTVSVERSGKMMTFDVTLVENPNA